MTLNVRNHEKELLSAYEKVVNSKDNEDWVIFDYEGTSNTLKVGEVGDSGLEELSTSFNAGRVQFGVIGVRLSEKALPKIVLIHWQGEGVSTSRISSSANHVREVAHFLKTVHCTIHGRSEMDVEPDVIRQEVAKLPGANVTQNVESTFAAPEPVNSVYRPVKPNRDINTREREEFWGQIHKEDEAQRRDDQRAQLEKNQRSVREREEMVRHSQKKMEGVHIDENQNRNGRVPSPSVSSAPVPPPAPSPVYAPAAPPLQKQPAPTKHVEPVRLTSDRRKMFEANKDESIPVPKPPRTFSELPARPMHDSTAQNVVKASPTSTPVSVSVPQSLAANSKSLWDSAPASEQQKSPKSPQSPTYVASAASHSSAMIPPPITAPVVPTLVYQEPSPPTIQAPTYSGASAPKQPSDMYNVPPEAPPVPEPASEPSAYYEAVPEELPPPPMIGVCAKALWDYRAEDETEISFDPDDTITEIDQIDEGWWKGRAPDGRYGLFPANFVALL